MNPIDPADRPDPAEQPIRARVPEHVTGGAFSTGVIVMTAQTEFILDFVQNLGRPHQIVSRVVMPHSVLPQLVDALHRNMELYRSRWGELPLTPGQSGNPTPSGKPAQSADQNVALQAENPAPESLNPESQTPKNETQGTPTAEAPAPPNPPESSGGGVGGGVPLTSGPADQAPPAANPPENASPNSGAPQQPPGARQASAQEIYDDLKIRDELLSGAYANAVMIGHGPHEFSFDFITNFYPHSAVSARVFLAAGQIPRLYDSLKGTWDQLRQRLQPPPGGSPPPFPPDGNPPIA